MGSIPLFKIPKEKIISIAAALDLACADIIICQHNKKWDAPIAKYHGIFCHLVPLEDNVNA
jgi:hypothetical protein